MLEAIAGKIAKAAVEKAVESGVSTIQKSFSQARDVMNGGQDIRSSAICGFSGKLPQFAKEQLSSVDGLKRVVDPNEKIPHFDSKDLSPTIDHVEHRTEVEASRHIPRFEELLTPNDDVTRLLQDSDKGGEPTASSSEVHDDSEQNESVSSTGDDVSEASNGGAGDEAVDGQSAGTNHNDVNSDKSVETLDDADQGTEDAEGGTESDEKLSYRIHTRNEGLEGDRHPVTGVPFEEKTVEDADGNEVTGVFPQFDSEFDAQLPEDKLQASDSEQFSECNEQLKSAVENDPELAAKFTPEQLEQIANGDTPDGYTWHHNEEKGKMQLVDSQTHAQTGHTGGRSVWGGGTENR